MTTIETIAQLRAEPLPTVIIERWTGSDGWPAFRVYLLASIFGQHGDRHVECPDVSIAHEVAGVLAACTGWPITDLSVGGHHGH